MATQTLSIVFSAAAMVQAIIRLLKLLALQNLLGLAVQMRHRVQQELRPEVAAVHQEVVQMLAVLALQE
tara:strand:+ start:314 stop:520 length:207 start_codon:yes stop_codon:yes gene_type:complete